jgi:ketosteroid isomerase-like protein
MNWKTANASSSGRGSTVLKRVGDRWWIVHEHLSRNPR